MMGTPVGWADPLFISILRGLGCSGDPIGLDSECSRRVNMLQGHMYRGRHHVSLTRRRRPALGANAGVRTDPVAVRTIRGHEHGWSTVVVHEVLPRAVSQAPKVISLWSAKGKSSTPEVVVVKHSSRGRFPGKGSIVAEEVLLGSTQRAPIVVRLWSKTENIRPTRWLSFSIVPGEGFNSCRGSSARVNTKGLNSGPLVVHDGEHQTNLMVVVQLYSRGSSALVRDTRLLALLQRS
ncbi:hypothetical protein TIFTF001_028060 [Ficus carica]|uniref:Uncharacterized protein n=1 Tax=Ficus carica TaxID=3494 RepID=A0AA88DP88_FICCA|nr:hypothetical protein TIFTF001_028060 [Ficus carica]